RGGGRAVGAGHHPVRDHGRVRRGSAPAAVPARGRPGLAAARARPAGGLARGGIRPRHPHGGLTHANHLDDRPARDRLVLCLAALLFFEGFFVSRVAQLDAFFAQLPLVFMFFAPALGMRLLAEERGTGTIELLLTMPVRDREVVIGKYVAALALLTLGLVATL